MSIKEIYGYRRINSGIEESWFCSEPEEGPTSDEAPWFKFPKFVVNTNIIHTKEKLARKQITLIQRQFEAANPMEKCYTDVTEFAIPNSTHKLYLSPVLDGFNSEIIAYNLSTSPNLEQVKSMLDQSFTEEHYENTILHSD